MASILLCNGQVMTDPDQLFRQRNQKGPKVRRLVDVEALAGELDDLRAAWKAEAQAGGRMDVDLIFDDLLFTLLCEQEERSPAAAVGAGV